MTAAALRAGRPAAATAGHVRAASRRWVYWSPLAVVLAAQVLLSVRLVPGSYASGDEGRYIFAGHQLIYEFWHGGGSPYYETFFSGAPVIYPVLAAVADHLGGLVAVCLMSTVFMAVTTVMLFLVTRDLFGYWSGLLAAGLFAGLGLTQDLAALATYDAMALMLIAVAAYCAVRAGAAERTPTGWLLAVPAVLFLANATKYMTILFDPVVVTLAALQSLPGWKAVARRIASLGLATLALDSLALFLAGGAYVRGLLFSTLERKAGSSSVFAAVRVGNPVIVGDTWTWIGPILVASVVALAIAMLARAGRRHVATIALLIAAGLIVTIEGLHLHTVESMRKHDDFSAWFACAATGSIAARLTGRAAARPTRAVLQALHARRLLSWIAAVLVGLAVVASGVHYSQTAKATYEAGGSPVTLQMASALRPYLSLPGGRFLIGGLANEQLVYIGGLGLHWYQLADDLYIKYPIPGRGGDAHGQNPGPACFSVRPGCMYLEGIAGYRAAIHAHWFDLICMFGNHGSVQDAQIEQAVENTPGYVLISVIAGTPTWIYAPAYRHLAA